MKSAIFLDRDGVINRAIVRSGKPYPPATMDELEILPGVDAALTSLRQAGYLLIVVTNQPDVARGTTSKEFVDCINESVKSRLQLNAIYTCFHDTAEDCDCRKPKPGLLLMAARDLQINLSTSFMIGDRWRDIDAGKQAGCKTFFVDYGYNEQQPVTYDYRVASLREASEIILQKETLI